MPIDLIWDDTIPNVIHYQLHPGWTWEEFRETALREHALGEALNGVRYDILGDLRNAIVPQGTSISNVLRLFEKGPQNRKTIVVCGSTLARALIGVATKIHPQTRGRFYGVDTIEDARQMILDLRSAQAHK